MSKAPVVPEQTSAGLWIRAWLPVAIGIAVIAVESTAFFGTDETSGPLRRIWEQIFGFVSSEHWEIVHHTIRKTGHFLGYGIIGLLWLRAWWMTIPRAPFRIHATLAVLGTALVAGSDEFHQSFLPNRTGVFSDVILDCSGAVVLLILASLFRRTRLLRRFVPTS